MNAVSSCCRTSDTGPGFLERPRRCHGRADLAKDDKDHARYDDVRAAAMAVAAVKADGVARWAGTALSAAQLGDVPPYRDVVERGINEVGLLLKFAGVK